MRTSLASQPRHSSGSSMTHSKHKYCGDKCRFQTSWNFFKVRCSEMKQRARYTDLYLYTSIPEFLKMRYSKVIPLLAGEKDDQIHPYPFLSWQGFVKLTGIPCSSNSSSYTYHWEMGTLKMKKWTSIPCWRPSGSGLLLHNSMLESITLEEVFFYTARDWATIQEDV